MFLSDIVLHFGSELRGLVHVGEPLIQLFLPLDAPDGDDVVLAHEGHGGVGPGDQAARQGFHADKAHAGCKTFLHHGSLFFHAEIAVGVLQGLIEAAPDDFFSHFQLVGGGADVADLALGLGFQKTFIHAGPVAGPVALLHIVELIDVDIVCLEESQGGLQILPENFRGLCVGLGSDDDLFPVDKACAEGLSQLLFAVGIAPCSVKKAHASAVGFAQDLHCFLLGNTLDGKGTEAVLRNNNACFSQFDLFHETSIPRQRPYCCMRCINSEHFDCLILLFHCSSC